MSIALLNFGTRANNIGHGPLDYCCVKENFSARVPRNLGGPRQPQKVVSSRLKIGLRTETKDILVPSEFELVTNHETEGSGVENWPSGPQNLVLFAGGKMASKNRGQICFWSNDAIDMFMDLRPEATIQFEIAKPQRKREMITAR